MMSEPRMSSIEGSYLAPAFENACVSDAMRHGVMTSAADTPVRLVARMMSENHVHSVVLTDVDDAGHAWGIFSDLDLLHAAEGDLDTRTAGEIAATELVTVKPDDSLSHAAKLMAERELSHLVVVGQGTERPVGVLSTLDIAGVLAWGRA